jgi:hypothetical protein
MYCFQPDFSFWFPVLAKLGSPVPPVQGTLRITQFCPNDLPEKKKEKFNVTTICEGRHQLADGGQPILQAPLLRLHQVQ